MHRCERKGERLKKFQGKREGDMIAHLKKELILQLVQPVDMLLGGRRAVANVRHLGRHPSPQLLSTICSTPVHDHGEESWNTSVTAASGLCGKQSAWHAADASVVAGGADGGSWLVTDVQLVLPSSLFTVGRYFKGGWYGSQSGELVQAGPYQARHSRCRLRRRATPAC